MTRTTELTAEGVAFLQQRVARFGLLAGSLALTFWIYRLLVIVWSGQAAGEWSHPSMLTHFGSAACLLGLWWVLNRRPFSVSSIRALETVAVVLASSLLIAMGGTIPVLEAPALIVILALTLVLAARAVYVPSSARHTLLIGVGVGLALVIGIYSSLVSADLSPLVRAEPRWRGRSSGEYALAVTLSSSVWWTLSTALTVATSRVIYGLRKQVGAIKQLGQYQIESKLGAGGMGVVYRARHAMLRRETAVKLLPPEKAGEAAVLRFEREVKLTARLKHQNTVTIYDYGRTPDGVFYYAMELLDGVTLEELVEATGPLNAARVAYVLGRAAGSLAEAHALGLIHRDIKPSNIMLCNQGGEMDVVKVLDFGLVKQIDDSEALDITQEGSITGTPMYLAPEALKGSELVDARSDLYALGAVGYYLLAGDHVFSGNSLVEICSKHLYETPVPLSERNSPKPPAALERLVLQCLAKDPNQRPQSAREVMRLAQSSVDEPWSLEDAAGWWREHQSALATRPAGKSLSGSHTIQIDLGARRVP